MIRQLSSHVHALVESVFLLCSSSNLRSDCILNPDYDGGGVKQKKAAVSRNSSSLPQNTKQPQEHTTSKHSSIADNSFTHSLFTVYESPLTMTLKRVQTALSKSPVPGPRAKRLAAANSRLNPGNHAATTDYSSTADDTHSTLETLATLDDTHSAFDGRGPAVPPHSAASQSVYYNDDDEYNSQFQEDRHDDRVNDNRERSVTVMNDREGSTFSSAARERSHTVVPQVVLTSKPKSDNSNSSASTYTRNVNTAQNVDTVMHGEDNSRYEENVDLSDKARLALVLPLTCSADAFFDSFYRSCCSFLCLYCILDSFSIVSSHTCGFTVSLYLASCSLCPASSLFMTCLVLLSPSKRHYSIYRLSYVSRLSTARLAALTTIRCT